MEGWERTQSGAAASGLKGGAGSRIGPEGGGEELGQTQRVGKVRSRVIPEPGGEGGSWVRPEAGMGMGSDPKWGWGGWFTPESGGMDGAGADPKQGGEGERGLTQSKAEEKRVGSIPTAPPHCHS